MNKYIQERELGTGVFGRVYLIRSKKKDEEFAMKVFHKVLDQTSAEYVNKEVEVLSRLSHPHIVAYIESFIDKGRACIVMAFCDGGTLAERIKMKKEKHLKFTKRQILVIFRQLCLAVHYIHDGKLQVVHRDIKPENILFSCGQVKLGDFGVSKTLDRDSKYMTTITGTPCYMSPEIFGLDNYTNMCDIWSMGCVLYEMTTLKIAFLGKMNKIFRGSYEHVPDSVDPELRDLIDEQLQVNARDRPSASQILEKPIMRSVSAESSSDELYNLLLVGKTGHGKSSTANTILGRDFFKVSDSGDSETNTTNFAVAMIDSDVMLKVIDTPGLADTRKSEEVRTKEAVEKLSEGFKHCSNGLHAMILVLKYGTRFTQEEQDTVDFLKKMFGNSFIRDRCILVFTNGETFETTKGKEGLTLAKWCEGQSGALGNLIKECGNRVVLFHNCKPEKRDDSVHNLLALVQSFGERYTCELFGEIKRELERLIATTRSFQLVENIQSRLNIIIDLTERVKDNVHSHELLTKHLFNIKNEIHSLDGEIAKISQENASAKEMTRLNETVRKLQSVLESHIKQIKKTGIQKSLVRRIIESLIPFGNVMKETEEEGNSKMKIFVQNVSAAGMKYVAFLGDMDPSSL